MHTNTNTFCTHSEMKRGPTPESVGTSEVEVNLWSCLVSDLLDDSENSYRVFLFDDILSRVVPTATMLISRE